MLPAESSAATHAFRLRALLSLGVGGVERRAALAAALGLRCSVSFSAPVSALVTPAASAAAAGLVGAALAAAVLPAASPVLNLLFLLLALFVNAACGVTSCVVAGASALPARVQHSVFGEFSTVCLER